MVCPFSTFALFLRMVALLVSPFALVDSYGLHFVQTFVDSANEVDFVSHFGDSVLFRAEHFAILIFEFLDTEL